MVVKDKFLEANMLITQQTKLFLFEQNLSQKKNMIKCTLKFVKIFKRFSVYEQWYVRRGLVHFSKLWLQRSNKTRSFLLLFSWITSALKSIYNIFYCKYGLRVYNWTSEGLDFWRKGDLSIFSISLFIFFNKVQRNNIERFACS